MRASYKWLKSLVPGLADAPAALADRLTQAGLEVEAVHTLGAAADACLFARVVAVRPHPTKSGLRLVTVERGGGSRQEVVCGAPNVPAPDHLVVLAPLGTRLPGGVIERRTIAGVASEGMLVSEDELGLSDDGAGIMVFAPDFAAVGATLASKIPEASDTVLEIGLPANRADALGHVGLAREICALSGLPFAPPEPGAPRAFADVELASLGIEITVVDRERCPHYGAAAVVDVRIGPSPAGVRWRLGHLGVRAISNVVDVTNLAMLEHGQPMHAFDLDLVRQNRIVVRRAAKGEVLVTLDGVRRTLDEDDLLICDGEGPVALAGVMGGEGTEIRKETSRVLFECAYFEPRGIRRASRRHGMRTESSVRFERGTDRSQVERVLQGAVRLTGDLAPESRAVKGEIHVKGPPEVRPRVTLRRARMDALLGLAVPYGRAREILVHLGCEVVSASEGEALFEIPPHRPDLAREVDLVEEVIRVHGMNEVPAILPRIRASRPVGGVEELVSRARRAAVALGLSEAMTWAFTSEEALEKIAAPHPAVVLANPLARHHAVMRTSLLPGLFEAVAQGRRRGGSRFLLFALGARYLPASSSGEGLPEERPSFAAILAGHRPAHLAKPAPFDVWDAKAVALGVVERMTGRACHVHRGAARHLHPRGAADLFMDGTIIGAFGPVHPDVAEAFELGEGAVVVELDLEALRAHHTPRFAELPRFPASPRDVALVVHDDVACGDLEAAIREAAGSLAEDVWAFDRFTGGAIPEDHASLAFRVVYRAPDRTLTDAEVDAAHARVVETVNARFGATVR